MYRIDEFDCNELMELISATQIDLALFVLSSHYGFVLLLMSGEVTLAVWNSDV